MLRISGRWHGEAVTDEEKAYKPREAKIPRAHLIHRCAVPLPLRGRLQGAANILAFASRDAAHLGKVARRKP